MTNPWDSHAPDLVRDNKLMHERIAEQAREIERLSRERDQATVLVGALAALIPLSETIEATRTGTTMIQWFKEHLRAASEPDERRSCHCPALPGENCALTNEECLKRTRVSLKEARLMFEGE